jgi:hypothetical protein
MPGNRNRHRSQQVINTHGQPIVAVQVNPTQIWADQPSVIVTAEIAPAPEQTGNGNDKEQIRRLQDQINQLKKSNKTFKTELRQEKKEVTVITKKAEKRLDDLCQYLERQDKIGDLVNQMEVKAYGAVFNEGADPRKHQIIINRITKDQSPCFRMTAFEWTQLAHKDKSRLLDRWHNDGTPLPNPNCDLGTPVFYSPGCPLTDSPWDSYLMPLFLNKEFQFEGGFDWTGVSDEDRARCEEPIQKVVGDLTKEIQSRDFIPLFEASDVQNIFENVSTVERVIKEIGHTPKNTKKIQKIIDRQSKIFQDIVINAIHIEIRDKMLEAMRDGTIPDWATVNPEIGLVTKSTNTTTTHS